MRVRKILHSRGAGPDALAGDSGWLPWVSFHSPPHLSSGCVVSPDVVGPRVADTTSFNWVPRVQPAVLTDPVTDSLSYMSTTLLRTPYRITSWHRNSGASFVKRKNCKARGQGMAIWPSMEFPYQGVVGIDIRFPLVSSTIRLGGMEYKEIAKSVSISWQFLECGLEPKVLLSVRESIPIPIFPADKEWDLLIWITDLREKGAANNEHSYSLCILIICWSWNTINPLSLCPILVSSSTLGVSCRAGGV